MYFPLAFWCWPLLLLPSLVYAAPFLEGTVTDEQARPVSQVSVKIWDCIGTCLGGKTVLSDDAGHYIFDQKPFQNHPHLTISLPGSYEVSRKQTGPNLYDPDSTTPRRIDFVLGTPAAASVYLTGEAPAGWRQTLAVRSGKNVETQRYDSLPLFTTNRNDWHFETLPRHEDFHLVVTRAPAIAEEKDLRDMNERERQTAGQRFEIVSPAIQLSDPQRYDIRATIAADPKTGSHFIVIESVTNALGIECIQELTHTNPNFGPPVDADTREKALALLNRVEQAAQPWNAQFSKKIASYEYDAVEKNGQKTHVSINHDTPSGPSWNDIARQHGFAYMPPLRWLFSQQENVVFHGLNSDKDHVIVHYQLKEKRGLGAGLGIGPSWNGFFTSSFSAGTVVIDNKTATVLEHRLSNGLLGEETIETFSDYVPIGRGYAPRSLRIQSSGFDFRLSFHIHNDQLWLLDQAVRGDDKQPSLKIENVVVNIAN